MADNLRKSGIEVLGDIPWGSHFSYFYETQQDLLDTEASYFKAGLENNEYCFWILPDINKHLAKEKASDALKKLLPDLNRHLEQGNMEIVSREEWFLKEDIFDLQSVIQNFSEKLKKALAKGYEGMRVNGGSSWLLEVGQGEDLHTLEHTIDKSIANQRVIMLCNFPLKKTMGHEIFDVMHNHKFGIARRNGQWEVFETPELLEAKEELKEINIELEERVAERTRQLAILIEELKNEIEGRRIAEEKINESYQQIRSLSEHLRNIREEEQTRIAREIHDVLGQQLTVMKLEVNSLNEGINEKNDPAKKKLQEISNMIDETIRTIRKISSELRPKLLDDLGLGAAMEWQLKEFERRSGIQTYFNEPEEEWEIPAKTKTGLFRIFQEALTNITRHSKATSVQVQLTKNDGQLQLSVKDNGRGFAPQQVAQKKTLGILGMQERATLMGGDYQILSEPGKGTKITVRLPIHS